MLQNFNVEIEEKLSKRIVVLAEDAIEAIQKVKEYYYAECIVLTADDCKEVDFCAEPCKSREIWT